MENKIWIVMREEEPVCACFTKADAEEIFADIVMEIRYENFCYDWLEFNHPLEICLDYEHTCSCGCYWIHCVSAL